LLSPMPRLERWPRAPSLGLQLDEPRDVCDLPDLTVQGGDEGGVTGEIERGWQVQLVDQHGERTVPVDKAHPAAIRRRWTGRGALPGAGGLAGGTSPGESPCESA